MLNNHYILAVDFDGTLSFGKWPGAGPANQELIEFLIKRKRMGDKLILWTCREAKALETAVSWCEENGLRFDAVNDNIPEIVEIYGVNSRKIGCDFFIDDRAVMISELNRLKEFMEDGYEC